MNEYIRESPLLLDLLQNVFGPGLKTVSVVVWCTPDRAEDDLNKAELNILRDSQSDTNVSVDWNIIRIEFVTGAVVEFSASEYLTLRRVK